MEFFTILLSSVFFITILIITRIHSKRVVNLPPGPRKLPFIGHLHLFATHYPPHRTLKDLASKYGSIMYLQLGEITTIVISSPKAAKEILKTHDENFANRPSLVATKIMCYDNTDIAFAPYGDYWRQLRKICTMELLSTKRVQSFRHIRQEQFLSLCRWIASNEGSRLNLSKVVESTTYEMVTRASVGKKTEEQDVFLSANRETIEAASGLDIGDVFPSSKFLQVISGTRKRIQRLHKKTDRLLENMIYEHRLSSKSIKHEEDLLDVLLKFQDDESGFPLTTDNIKAILMDMFSAGSETSSGTTDWAMAEMLRNPKVLMKAQEEIRQIFCEKRTVDESLFHELKYLKLVIKETLRMHPPVPLLLPRQNKEWCKINGYRLPPKTRVLVNAWAMGRDPEYWKEPESFKPERFLDNSADFRGKDFEYIPFGAGKRICPGMNFGLANVELPLAMFLYHFDWKSPDGMKTNVINMEESFGATTRRKNPLYVIPIVYKPVPSK